MNGTVLAAAEFNHIGAMTGTRSVMANVAGHAVRVEVTRAGRNGGVRIVVSDCGDAPCPATDTDERGELHACAGGHALKGPWHMSRAGHVWPNPDAQEPVIAEVCQ